MQRLRIVLAQGTQRKAQEFEDIQTSFLVLAVEALVLALVVNAVHRALLGEKDAPQIVGVPGEQGVVQIENGQGQGRFLVENLTITNYNEFFL